MSGLDWVPLRTLGSYTRRSGDALLIESYRDAYELNESGAFVWLRVGSGETAAVIADELAQRYELDREDAQRHVDAFLQQLVSHRFVVAP